MIERFDKYKFEGCVFDSLTEVRKYIENELGRIIDTIQNYPRLKTRFDAAQRLAVLDMLTGHRERLCNLLSAKYDVESTGKTRTESIFLYSEPD